MTIAKRFPMTSTTSVVNNTEIAKTAEQVEAVSYSRILVLIDSSSTAERVIPAALNMAHGNNAEIILITQSQPGSEAFINNKCRELEHQGIKANGYTVSSDMANLPAWLIQSEKADAIMMAQKPVGWLGRLLGEDAAANLQARTEADVYVVAV